ncbi:N-acylneuraminate cytidylyltransferase A-like [Macrosteles quadrilineatus]|uniref:N-acylneuraminate cytidylyltransferase A-like n=1 Tax=Macrosteles quadrilineatus TaxID=74068 RepID=UPI0023E0BF2A|nr:N-acylneuraminate cytidylyltransferase A-like [Macrosteles quadrilineatus]
MASVEPRTPLSPMPPSPPADCQECKRHFLAIAAVVVCLAGCLLVLKVDKDIIVEEKIEPVVATKLVGLILARGGSKGLARKNLATINNKTLLSRALTAMANSNCFDELWVSTEDKEIAEEALKYEANVHQRPASVAEDNTSSILAVQEFVERHPDVRLVGLVQCTSPFIKAQWLREACLMMTSQGYDSVFSAARQKNLRWEPAENGTVKELNFNTGERPRRQEWNGELVENGMFYFATTELVNQNKLQGGRVGYVEVPKNYSLEVDTPLDLLMGEALAPILDPTLDNPD